jgi:hypothetical protein
LCPWAADRLPAGVFLNLTKGPERSVTPQVIAGFQGSQSGVRVRESRPNGTRVGHDAAVTGSVSSDHRATTDRTARCSRTLYAVGIDVSAAYVAGVSQATWCYPRKRHGSCATTSAPNSCPPWREASALEVPFLTRRRDPRGHEGDGGPRGACAHWSVTAVYQVRLKLSALRRPLDRRRGALTCRSARSGGCCRQDP